MLGPIPNSLGAGAYNGSFMPHGLVTFSTRGNVVIIRQEICVDGGVVTSKAVVALFSNTAQADAGFVNQVPADAGVVTIKTADGGFINVLVLDGGIEEC